MARGITILYNGKQFSRVEKAKAPDEQILATVGMALDVEAALEPLRAEIEKQGAQVSVDLKGPSMFEIYTKHISDKLKQKVLKALTPPD